MDEPNTQKTILIVDDDFHIRETLSLFLGKMGFQTVLAEDALKGLGILQDKQVDLVIVDVHLPVMSGIDFTRQVLKKTPNFPIIIITGQPEVAAAVDCVKMGAVDYMSKPFDLFELKRAIDATFAQNALQSSLSHRKMIGGYKIVHMLGEGNIGVVFLVEKDEQEMCLKVLKTSMVSPDKQEVTFARFRNEAEAAMSVKHPNILEVFDYGFTQEDQIPYIVMEYFRGEDLIVLGQREPALSYEEKATILLQVAEALDAVHARGITHRDLKPSNIMVDDSGKAKVMDFGLAHLPDSDLTQAEDVFGTPAYMSPESVLGATSDHRADIFSFGATAYSFLCRRPPFTGKNVIDIATKIKEAAPTEPLMIDPYFPIDLQDILAGMLRKDKEERYQSAKEVAIDLKAYLDGEDLLPSDVESLPGDWDFL